MNCRDVFQRMTNLLCEKISEKCSTLKIVIPFVRIKKKEKKKDIKSSKNRIK